MKTKITFLLLAFFSFVSKKYSSFDAPKFWTDLVQTVILQFQEIIAVYQYIAPLRAISGTIDSSPLRVESLIKAIQPINLCNKHQM
jgi:hypothetical protein